MPDSVIRIVGQELPGRAWSNHANVHVGIQHNSAVTDLARGDATAVMFTVPVTVVPDNTLGVDFRGPAVHGPRGRRFIYLSWGDVDNNGRFTRFRRAKLTFATMPDHVLRALSDGCTVQATLTLTGRDVGPLCASIKDQTIHWLVSDARSR